MTTVRTWFRSSYSGTQGDNCIEVAMDWFKSSYSGSSGDNCIEVAAAPDSVHVRDSKDQARGRLTVTATAWSAFVAYATYAREDIDR
jgi:hypothetical protein